MAKKKGQGTAPRGPGKPFVKGQAPKGGRPKGVPNKATREAKDFCLALVDNPAYRRRFAAAFVNRTIEPALEILVWHYAKGKPATTITATINFDHAGHLAALTPDKGP